MSAGPPVYADGQHTDMLYVHASVCARQGDALHLWARAISLSKKYASHNTPRTDDT